ncbi:adenylosuccinate synthetase [Labrys sp. (in: a-proteobacteria)]|uniref:adenylosuccinate synthetase n=1 Tax=Labrys sp. (in: a-proteobacteria) TaxID=1917972 RepID=UPI0039E60849
MRVLIALSGPVGVGKSSFCEVLKARFDADRFSTRELLLTIGAKREREDLQATGERLDRETDGKWVSDALARKLSENSPQVIIVDAIRIKKQIDHIRRHFGDRVRVWHVFIDADDEVLRARYHNRHSQIGEFTDYDQLQNSETERAIRSLKAVADRVVDASRCEPDSVVAQAVAGLGLYPLELDRLVDVVVGGQYGSEGKGHVCSYLASGYDMLVRVGGPNAGHWAALPEKIKYIQLPSGTAANAKADIVIGAGATLYLPQLLKEIGERGLTAVRLSIDPQAMIIEDADRTYESTHGDAIGSTKQGVGAATARKILGRFHPSPIDIPVRLARDVAELKNFVRPAIPLFEAAFARGKKVFLEGTQGTDLSLHHGVCPSEDGPIAKGAWPHVTSRDTTASGCLADAGIAPGRVRKVIMVTRTYPIRVGGTSGPIAREITYKAISDRSGVPAEEIAGTEKGSISRNPRRIAEFDWEQVRRASSLNGATDIALSFSDYISIENRKARQYADLTEETRHFIEGVERVTNAPVSLISTRFEPRGIIDRRNWL